MTTYPLNFEDMSHSRVTSDGRSVKIGSFRIGADDQIDFGAQAGTIDVSQLLDDGLRFDAAGMSSQPQLAAYLFAITRKPRLMNHYFPLTRALELGQEAEFHKLVVSIANHPSFDLRLYGENRANLTAKLPPDAGYLVAGHIAEMFFQRRDLLDLLLSQKRGFFLYATPQAFKDDGGAAGGCYHSQRDAIQLVLSRLYEGFYQPMPGVAPFIHEFGHMLDHASGNRGLIPGMTEVIDSFRAGKALELERYERVRQGHIDALPIGHPYVFQNDGEFIAGYLEMFFRNPHTFAAQNPALYEAFSGCLKQDSRQYWQQDFPYYVEQNRAYYRSGQKPPKAGITLAY